MNISNKNNKTNNSYIKPWLLMFLSVFIAVVVFLFLGCSIPGMQVADTTQAETNSGKTSEEHQSPETTAAISPSTQNTAEETASDVETGEENNNEEAGAGEIAINVYYSDMTGEYLVGETRIVPEENKYVEAVYEMLKEPTDANLTRLIPDTTKINDITVEDGLARVDLSSNFIDDRFISDVVDILLVYSVVNTLTEFDEINSVEFYIDGERLDLIGMLDLVDPLFRRSDLIK